ncbi:hypothetical protein DERF_008475 [Dermatophagoides farinae]|uniref:protein-tyrosine-phosphatase n=1 Tax=Dermatophagoides farinae TaxID=6954 RepID=A0A922I2F7_DERFA|nr:hypothetical protein DERF_008475 [Dermatophagoides farinae]
MISYGDDVSAIQQCYDSPADLFQVFPQINGTFKIKIKNKCLQLPELEIYLYVFDLSIVDQIFIKEIDQLDVTKVNSIKINRPTMLFGHTELTNFHPPNARFKFGIVFFDHTGVVNIALHPKVFYFFTNQSNSSTTEILLIIILGILLLITCILLAMLIYINYCGNRRQKENGILFWRKQRPSNKMMKTHLLNDQENPTAAAAAETFVFEPKSNIIHVDKIITMIPDLLNEERIRQEYDSVPKSKMNSWNDGRLPQHKTKNRYGNLLPYDHTRVILKEDLPEDTNYINANFIDGYRRPKRYIASQGPIDTTIEDFWRCIWQYKCQQIVMLTNLEESGRMKCEKYWPEISQFYGKIKVTLQSTELFADYVIRSFLCEKSDSQQQQQMIVNQYHFISWPDHNVPLYVCTLISFINRIRTHPFYKESSHIIVHCSAGIGRTGAFILIDSMLEMARKEKKIDILGHFCKMRLQRINMVEKFSQYVFVYHILVEALSHESSDISCNDFESYFEMMTKGNHHHHHNNHYHHKDKCRLRKQFEILNIMSFRKSTANQASKFGLINSKLNRREDVIPPDHARVILPNHEDYINAVYINGYRKKDAYIVTQIPFENNRQQFWKMIENTRCTTIVLLGDVFNDDQIKFDFNNNELSITLVKEEMLSGSNILMRTFQIRPDELIVRQFHLKNLNTIIGNIDGTIISSGDGGGGGGGVVSSSTTIISSTTTATTKTMKTSSLLRSCYELIELREKLDQYTTTNVSSSSSSSHPLVIQCIDGVQLSGLFCAADFIFERIKEEQQIDVFLAVQKIRANRPQFIINYEQYLYLHQVALAYLQSFDQYANFK